MTKHKLHNAHGAAIPPYRSEGIEELVSAAQNLIANKQSQYKDRGGRRRQFQDDNGELMYLVSFDEMLAVEVALRTIAEAGSRK